MNPLRVLRDVLRLVFFEEHPPRPTPEFSQLSEYRTRLVWGDLDIEFDKRLREVSRRGHALVRFDQIEAIVISRVGADPSSRWRVKLDASLFNTVRMGYTEDDADASIVAAQISALTGRQIRVARGLGMQVK